MVNRFDLMLGDWVFLKSKQKENRESDAAMMHRGGLEIPASNLKEIAHFHRVVKNYEKMDRLLKSEE